MVTLSNKPFRLELVTLDNQASVISFTNRLDAIMTVRHNEPTLKRASLYNEQIAHDCKIYNFSRE